MKDFERIKDFTAQVIKAFEGKTNQVRNWKKEIRACLMEVKNNFQLWLDEITNKFLNSLRDIDD